VRCVADHTFELARADPERMGGDERHACFLGGEALRVVDLMDTRPLIEEVARSRHRDRAGEDDQRDDDRHQQHRGFAPAPAPQREDRHHRDGADGCVQPRCPRVGEQDPDREHEEKQELRRPARL